MAESVTEKHPLKTATLADDEQLKVKVKTDFVDAVISAIELGLNEALEFTLPDASKLKTVAGLQRIGRVKRQKSTSYSDQPNCSWHR